MMANIALSIPRFGLILLCIAITAFILGAMMNLPWHWPLALGALAFGWSVAAAKLIAKALNW